MKCGFGSGYDFEMKRLGVNKGKYLMLKLENFEDILDSEEERLMSYRDTWDTNIATV